MDVVYLDIDDIKEICHPFAVAYFNKKEDPIPAFSVRAVPLLDSALHLPRQAFGGHELYPTLPKKAAMLFYGIIQNHPFENGNKRIATASLLVFLYINDYLLNVSQDDLAEKAIWIARAGERKMKKDILLPELEKWIENHIKKRDGKEFRYKG